MKKRKFIPAYEPDLSGNELAYVTECIKSSWISSQGEYLPKFEKKFSEFCNVKHSVAVFNGTVALHLALVTLGIKAGDEVIVPDLTFSATASPVAMIGAKPVLVDIDKRTWTADVNEIKKNITKKTKAIIPVHLFGHPCDMDPIMELAEKYNLFIIEDACQAIGSEYKGKKAGSIGHIGFFSFYGNKTITTGEGSICTTNNTEYADRMNFLKYHAMDPNKKFWHTEVGFNYRMTNLQAAIGVAQLERVDKFIEIKRKNARLYTELLSDLKDVQLPVEEKWAMNTYWMYSILTDKRDEIIKAFERNSIEPRRMFYGLHEMPPYEKKGVCPVSEELSKKGLSLPSSTKLIVEDIEFITDTIKSVY